MKHEMFHMTLAFHLNINVSRSESISMKQALLECFPCEMINYELETIMIAISFLNAVSTAMNTGLSHRGLYVGLFSSLISLGPDDSPVLNELHCITENNNWVHVYVLHNYLSVCEGPTVGGGGGVYCMSGAAY